MSEPSTRTSIKLFFKTFSGHLRIIRDEGKDSGQAYRAQILLGQLGQFEKAMYEALDAPQVKTVGDSLHQLMHLKTLNDLFVWMAEDPSTTSPETAFYQNDMGEWERCFGEAGIPVNLKVHQWHAPGQVGLLEKEEHAHLIMVFGQPRLILLFPKNESAHGDQELYAAFIARMAALFIDAPLRNKTRKFERSAGIIACDERFLETLALIERAAKRNVSILLEGESGVGKEVVAELVHRRSNRARKPLVAVNCAAIPAGLIESELFGHEKGAFTNAYQRQIGRVEEADGGTLFLDEIGEMDHAVQAKMLRFLQLHEFHRVGGKQKIKVDVRIVAATNRNLKQQIADGKFRDDLYYRLSVMPFVIPSLRERVGDIVPLTRFFMEKYSKKFGMDIPSIQPEVLQTLASYSFPGNVRELENIVQNMLVVSQGKCLKVEHLPESMQQIAPKQKFGPVEPKQPRKWRESNRKVRHFPWGLKTEQNEDLPIQNDIEWVTEVPEDNDSLKAAKKRIQEYANKQMLLLEHRFLSGLLERAEGSMPLASELGRINRTLLYKMLDRTKGVRDLRN